MFSALFAVMAELWQTDDGLPQIVRFVLGLDLG